MPPAGSSRLQTGWVSISACTSIPFNEKQNSAELPSATTATPLSTIIKDVVWTSTVSSPTARHLTSTPADITSPRDREIAAFKSGSGRETAPVSQRRLPKAGEKHSLLTRLGVSQPR